MSWYSKVVWSEGMFLRPQHFQQQDRYHEWLLEARTRALGGHFWGLLQFELDEAALLTGQVALVRASGVLPDGTPFDFPATHPAPTALDFPAELRNAVVHLALPLRRANAVETVRPDQPQSELARQRQADEEVLDSTGTGSATEAIEVGLPRLRLTAGAQGGDGHVRIGVVRVAERRADNVLVLDRGYIPPLLCCAASPVLSGWLQEIRGLLAQRGQALAARLAQPGSGGLGEIADFIFLLTLNRHQPVLDHLAALSQLHPEHAFTRLLELHGELATLTSSGRRPLAMPAYQHDALQASFAPLLRELRLALATVLEQNAIPIELKDHQQGRYVGLIPDRSLLRQAGFVLAVKARLPGETLRTRFPAQAKLGPLERLREIVNLQLPGVRLTPLPVAPRQLPYHAGFSYFELDQSGELWSQLEQSGGLGIYVTGEYPELELALWAIRS